MIWNNIQPYLLSDITFLKTTNFLLNLLSWEQNPCFRISIFEPIYIKIKLEVGSFKTNSNLSYSKNSFMDLHV